MEPHEVYRKISYVCAFLTVLSFVDRRQDLSADLSQLYPHPLLLNGGTPTAIW